MVDPRRWKYISEALLHHMWSAAAPVINHLEKSLKFQNQPPPVTDCKQIWLWLSSSSFPCLQLCCLSNGRRKSLKSNFHIHVTISSYSYSTISPLCRKFCIWRFFMHFASQYLLSAPKGALHNTIHTHFFGFSSPKCTNKQYLYYLYYSYVFYHYTMFTSFTKVQLVYYYRYYLAYYYHSQYDHW